MSLIAWNRTSLATVCIFLCSLFTISSVSSTSSGSVVVSSMGIINTSGNFAKSGSPVDIQAAVNTVVAAGGGTVYVPAGDWAFNPPAGGVGVTVYAGVNLVGAGRGLTILRETQECVDSVMMQADGTNGNTLTKDTQKPIKIQGISFIGFVPSRANAEDTTLNSGLAVHCVKDFLVYDCHFENFVNWCVGTDENDGHSPPRYWLRGVISSCSFDQPYKDDLTINSRIWGYGIICSGSSLGSDSPLAIATYGRYDTVPFPADLTYIEDCTFNRCRHSIAGTCNFGTHYVARYNTFDWEIQGGYGAHIDMHFGDTHNSVEAYNNTIIGEALDYRNTYSPPSAYIGVYQDKGILLRGGSALIYNNTITDCKQVGIGLTIDDPANPTDYVWVWNNQITYPNSGTGTSIDTGSIVHAYLRAPTQALDGFTYTPYPYPHPLIVAMR